MLSLTLLLQHGVLYGAILSVLMSLAFLGAAYLNPEIWLPDYPPDIRENQADPAYRVFGTPRGYQGAHDRGSEEGHEVQQAMRESVKT